VNLKPTQKDGLITDLPDAWTPVRSQKLCRQPTRSRETGFRVRLRCRESPSTSLRYAQDERGRWFAFVCAGRMEADVGVPRVSFDFAALRSGRTGEVVCVHLRRANGGGCWGAERVLRLRCATLRTNGGGGLRSFARGEWTGTSGCRECASTSLCYAQGERRVDSTSAALRSGRTEGFYASLCGRHGVAAYRHGVAVSMNTYAAKHPGCRSNYHVSGRGFS
jgi:hypothetical protein